MKQVAAGGREPRQVSRVVNGGTRVRADLADRVHEAVELLGYRHNLTASSLRRADRLSASIGLIFEDVANPFFSAVHRGVEEVARERGVLTFAGSSDERPDRERELAESFSARRVDGLIIAPASTDHSYLQRDREAGVALVFVDRPASFVDADVVLSDNAGGARAAVSHLIDHGHRRIAFLGDRPELHTATERLRGYRDALARHGIQEEAILIRSAREYPYALARELLLAPDPPTALSRARTSSPSTSSAPSTTSACSARSRSWASTTWRWPTSSSPASRWWPRTPPRSGAAPPSCCSRGSTATRARRGASCTPRR
jgi:LacI family transcriptional regulator